MKYFRIKSALLLAAGVIMPLSALFAQEMDHSKMDHASMTHAPEKTSESKSTNEAVDHSTMDHSKMDHSTMNHGASAAVIDTKAPLPVLTDADRSAAFPKLDAHSMHSESALQSMLLIDQLEVWDASPGAGVTWDAVAWVGSDLNRLWLKTEGEQSDSQLENAALEVLAGHSVAPWWDLLLGVRHAFKPGQSQDFLAVGIMGLSPYKFETALTAYVGEGGQTAVRMQVEYETLLSNRLILQPKLELTLYGKDDSSRAIGSGLSDAELGLRLRYEINRRFAPYIGVSWQKSYGQTAAYLRMDGESAEEFTVLAGVRLWF